MLEGSCIQGSKSDVSTTWPRSSRLRQSRFCAITRPRPRLNHHLALPAQPILAELQHSVLQWQSALSASHDSLPQVPLPVTSALLLHILRVLVVTHQKESAKLRQTQQKNSIRPELVSPHFALWPTFLLTLCCQNFS